MSRKIIAALFVILLISSCSYALDYERVRLGIMKFDSNTYDVSDRQAAAISDFFARMLFKSKGIMLVERERLDDVISELRLGMSGLVDEKTAAKIGKLAGCDYMLMGSITNLGHADSGFGVPVFGIPVSLGVKNQKVKATLDVRLVEVETGEIVFAETADGTASKSDTGIAAYGVVLTESEFSGIEGTAIADATSKLAPQVEKALTGTDTLTEILQADAKKSKSKAKASDTKTKTVSSRPKKSTRTPKADDTETIDAPVSVSSAAVDTPEPEVKSSSSERTAQLENKSTDPAKVIKSYGLPSAEANTLRIRHINLAKSGNKKRTYEEYVSLVEAYEGDYFAAYRAGEVAKNLKDNDNAKYWYEKALEINPDYEPAQKALKKLPASKKRKN